MSHIDPKLTVMVSCCCCCLEASVVSDLVRPHRRQPTGLRHPWDSPGKNTGVGCHFLLQGMKVKSESEVTQSCPTLSNPMDCSLRGSSIHEIFQPRVLEWVAIAFSYDKLHFILPSFFWLCHMACRILVPRPGIEFMPLQWKSGLNHWTTKEVPPSMF